MRVLSIGMIKPMIYHGHKTKNFISDEGVVFKKDMTPKKVHKIKGGYLRVGVTVKGKYKLALVHRLVVENFIGEIPKDMEVDHIDGNKENNSVSNLEIVTAKENMKRAKKNGLVLQGKDRTGTIYDEKIIRKICKRLEHETNKKKIAEELQVLVGLVRSIACGSKWKFISSEYNILPTKKKHRFTEAEVNNMLELYKTGASYKEIAKILGISTNSVIGAIQRYISEPKHPHHTYTEDEDRLILEMKKMGVKSKDIAKCIGVTKSAIDTRYRHLKQ